MWKFCIVCFLETQVRLKRQYSVTMLKYGSQRERRDEHRHQHQFCNMISKCFVKGGGGSGFCCHCHFVLFFVVILNLTWGKESLSRFEFT
jgi:hypothetical protein